MEPSTNVKNKDLTPYIMPLASSADASIAAARRIMEIKAADLSPSNQEAFKAYFEKIALQNIEEKHQFTIEKNTHLKSEDVGHYINHLGKMYEEQYGIKFDNQNYHPGVDEPKLMKVAQEAGHTYMLNIVGNKYVEETGGKFSKERSDNIVKYSQFVDEIRLFDGYDSGANYLKAKHNTGKIPDSAEIRKVYQESIHALNGHTVQENVDFYTGLIKAHPKDDAIVGIAMHGLVDSVFHADKGSNETPSREELMNMRTYPAPLGHAKDGSEVDHISENNRVNVNAVLKEAYGIIAGINSAQNQSVADLAEEATYSALSAAKETGRPNEQWSGADLEKNFDKVAKSYYPSKVQELMPENHHLPDPVIGPEANKPLTYFGAIKETAGYLHETSPAKAAEFLNKGIEAAITISNQYIEQYHSSTPEIGWDRFGLDYQLTTPNGPQL